MTILIRENIFEKFSENFLDEILKEKKKFEFKIPQARKMKIEINNSISISLFETEYTELSFGDQHIMIMNGSREQRRILLPWKIIPDGQKIAPSSSAETPLKGLTGQEF